MTRRPPPAPVPLEPTLDGDANRKHALRVACPPRLGCGQPIGAPCLTADGRELPGPGHAHRVKAAHAEYPQDIPDLPPADDSDAQPESPRRRVGGGRKSACNFCGGALVWPLTRKDVHMPVDAEPSARGNVLLTVEDGVLRADVIGKRQQAAAMRAAGKALHVHHVVSCPYKSRWAAKK